MQGGTIGRTTWSCPTGAAGTAGRPSIAARADRPTTGSTWRAVNGREAVRWPAGRAMGRTDARPTAQRSSLKAAGDDVFVAVGLS
jgi:hypothetical protein